jgi:hypothetical protein
MKKITLHLKKIILFACGLAFCVFSAFNRQEEPTVLIENMLVKYYNNEAQAKLIKKHEIKVTSTGFCRYRKVFNNGKEEYFAFNLSRLKAIDYYGTQAKGDLFLRTNSDDVIVQTRNDKRGAIDSMGTYMVIPLKNIEPEALNDLAEQLKKLKLEKL